MIPIGVVMRRAREMRRMSQRQVAQAMGSGNQASISDWERGHAIPNMDTLERWAEAVGFVMTVSLTPAELVDEDAYPWQAKVVYKAPTFGHGPVEEEP